MEGSKEPTTFNPPYPRKHNETRIRIPAPTYIQVTGFIFDLHRFYGIYDDSE
jgi:hypothetical protein